MSKTYEEFQKDLGKKVLQDRRGVAVSDAVKDELIFRIYQWSQWNLLFQQAENGIIKVPESTNILDEILGDLEPGDGNKIPTKSDDFYPEFAETVGEVEGFAREKIKGAIAYLLSELSATVQQERNNLAEILPSQKIDDRIKQIKEKYGNENVRALQTLVRGAIEPKTWENGLLKKCKLQENNSSEINPETLFPLARAKTFAWGEEGKQINPTPANNQILVLRVRDEAIASAGLHIVELASKANQVFNNELGNFLKEIINEMQKLLQNEALLRELAEDEVANRSIPQWLQILWQISEMNFPN